VLGRLGACAAGWLILVGGLTLVGPASAGGPHETALPTPVGLAIDPNEWWVVTGNSSSLLAVWTGVSPSCSLTPEWYRWSIVGGALGGTLEPTNSSATNFSALAETSTVSTVELRATALLDCAGRASAVFRVAESNVSVEARLTLGPAIIAPDPAEPGAITNLSGTISGGTAPYRVRVEWGDGTVDAWNLSTSGPFRWSHRFPSGRFLPQIFVSDAEGLSANRSVAEVETVSGNLAASILPSTLEGEVGIAVSYVGRVENAPSGFGWAESCSGEPYQSVRTESSSPSITCTYNRPGPENATFQVEGPPPVNAGALAELTEPIEPALSVTVGVPAAPAEVGVPAELAVTVSGGVPPVTLSAEVVGAPGGDTVRAATDGTILLPVDPGRAGADNVTVVATDSLGVTASTSAASLTVDPPLAVADAIEGNATENGSEVGISDTVLAGVPPFDWVVVAAPGTTNATPNTGALDRPGTFRWNGTFATDAPISVSVAVADAAGAVWLGNQSAAPVAALRLVATIEPGSPGSILVNLSVSGGTPPFQVWVNSSGAPAWNATLVTDSTATWPVPTTFTGNDSVSVEAVDRFGAVASVDRVVYLPGTPPSAPGTSAPAPVSPLTDLAVLGALAAVAASLALGLAWRRRRRAPEPAPPPDARTILRGIIHPSDGVDRATVELLAEEAGVPFDAAHATLDRLIADGTVRSEVGSGGIEILAWAHLEDP